MIETRELTRREQLEWLLSFLLEQKEILESQIETTEMELKLERKKENGNNTIKRQENWN